jgi:hypothetical protein
MKTIITSLRQRTCWGPWQSTSTRLSIRYVLLVIFLFSCVLVVFLLCSCCVLVVFLLCSCCVLVVFLLCFYVSQIIQKLLEALARARVFEISGLMQFLTPKDHIRLVTPSRMLMREAVLPWFVNNSFLFLPISLTHSSFIQFNSSIQNFVLIVYCLVVLRL